MTWLNAFAAAALLLTIAPPALADEMREPARGVVRAQRTAALSTDLNALIASLPLREGEAFRAGELLVGFDCAELMAEVEASAAITRAEELRLINNQRLARLNAMGEFEVQMQAARVEQVRAEHRVLTTRLNRCEITAPFDGRISELFVNQSEFPVPNEPLMRITSPENAEIEILLPARWLRWLREGEAFEITIEESGERLSAHLTRFSAEVDPVSQTIRVFGAFDKPAPDVLPGMSGSVRFINAP